MGTIDYFEHEIKCPFCGEFIQVSMVSDDGFPPELAGGHARCEHCGEEIHDEDLD